MVSAGHNAMHPGSVAADTAAMEIPSERPAGRLKESPLLFDNGTIHLSLSRYVTITGYRPCFDCTVGLLL